MNKEQIKQAIDSYGMFHNPKKLEECAEEVAALVNQALKEQLARIQKHLLEYGDIDDILVTLKAELEGNNERD
jgi:DNA-binding transcriptional MerR regulator